MKRLDRYVLVTFLKNYLISLAVLVGFYVVMDMVFNFDEFTQHARESSVWEVAAGVASYYFYQSFFVYAQLAGVIPVLAAAFTLMRMSRFNELTALLAAGVPLLRVAAPVILAAIAINLVVQPLNQELLIPRVLPMIVRDHDQAISRASRSFGVRAMPDGQGGIFDAARYHPPGVAGPTPWVETLTVVERGEEGQIERMIAAERGDWDAAAGVWRLTGGKGIRDVAGSAAPMGAAAAMATAGASPASITGAPAEPVEVLQTPITPEEIELFRSASAGVGAGGSYFDLLSTPQINELLARPRQYAGPDLLRAKHTRLAAHVMNIVLILLAIPAVLTRQPGQLRRAAAKTLLLVGTAMATVFFAQLLAREPPTPDLAMRWPAWMAWVPIMIFGPAAVLMLDRIET